MRTREAWTARGLLAAAGLVSCLGLGRAQTPWPEIVYRAPPRCPDAGAFAERVRARQRPAQGARTTTARRLEVRIEQRAGHTIGQLRVLGADGAVTQRNIEAATCDEAADALALIAALTLDLDAAEAPARSAPEPPDNRGGAEREPSIRDRDRSSPSETPAPGEVARDPAEEPSPAAEPQLGAAPQQSDDDGSQEDAAAAPAGDSDAADTTATSAGPGLRFARAGLFASGFAASGLAPDVVAGPQLSLAIVAQLGSAELALRAGARFTPERTITDPEGTAELSYVGGLAALCAGARLPAVNAALWGCFAFEPGRSVARGQQTRSDRFWAALGPGLSLQWDALGPLSLLAGAELLFPLVRDRYFLSDTVVLEVPSAAFRAELGIGLQIR